MSLDVQNFLKNIVYIGGGSAVSTLFMTVFTILGGRLMGPEEYGKFVLLQSVAMFLYIPMLLGFNTAMLKYTSEKPDTERQISIISTTYILVFIFTALSIALITVFRNALSQIFLVTADLFNFSIIYAAVFVFNTMAISVLRGLEKIRSYAVFQIVFASILLSIFLFLVTTRPASYESMTYPMIIAYGLNSIIIMLFFMRKYIKWKFDRSWAKVLCKYAVYSLVGIISFVTYSNVGKILISLNMNFEDVGIYNAYNSASVSVIGFFWGLFNIVYFPTVSKYADKQIIFKRIKKVAPYLVIFGVIFVIIGEYVILRLFGNKYPINFLLMVVFAVSSVLVVLYGLLDWTFASQGLKGIKLVNIGNVTIAVLSLIINYFLIPHLGLYGAALACVISYAAGIVCLFLVCKRI